MNTVAIIDTKGIWPEPVSITGWCQTAALTPTPQLIKAFRLSVPNTCRSVGLCWHEFSVANKQHILIFLTTCRHEKGYSHLHKIQWCERLLFKSIHHDLSDYLWTYKRTQGTENGCYSFFAPFKRDISIFSGGHKALVRLVKRYLNELFWTVLCIFNSTYNQGKQNAKWVLFFVKIIVWLYSISLLYYCRNH